MDTMKSLARKRAKKDTSITADEPDIQEAAKGKSGEDAIKKYERSKMDPGSSKDNVTAAYVQEAYKYPSAKVPGRMQDPEDKDKKMMKQRKKMMMLKSLIQDMDDMDGNGIPDSEER